MKEGKGKSGPDKIQYDPDSILSESDQYILGLNHMGFSGRQIVRSLKTDYGIILSRSSVYRQLGEMMQDPDNNVQVNFECTIPKPPKEEGKWYKVIERLKTNLEGYERIHKLKASSRTMLYQLIDERLSQFDISV
jgi:hypothetical protein